MPNEVKAKLHNSLIYCRLLVSSMIDGETKVDETSLRQCETGIREALEVFSEYESMFIQMASTNEKMGHQLSLIKLALKI